jgi:hypothetical protein
MPIIGMTTTWASSQGAKLNTMPRTTGGPVRCDATSVAKIKASVMPTIRCPTHPRMMLPPI